MVWTMRVLVFFCLSFMLPSTAGDRPDCSRAAMDLVFVVDSSGSLRESDFGLVKQFLVKVVQGLVVSPQNIRLGLLRFSSDVQVIAYLNQSESTEQMTNIISNMAYLSGGTHTSAALRATREMVLRRESGDRAGVADVAVVITDGRSWYADKTAMEAKLLRERNVEIIVLGIGRNLLMSELNAMTSGVVRHIQKFDDLDDVVDEIRGTVCTVGDVATEKLQLRLPVSLTSMTSLSPSSAATTTTTSSAATTTTATVDSVLAVTSALPVSIRNECQRQHVDVVFLQDSSYSVGTDSFTTAKLFLVHIVRQLPVGPHLVRVALVRFGTYADVIANLTQSTDVTAVTRAIEGMEYKTGGTQTGRALKTVRQQVLNETRPDARAVVVVITDGNSMKFRETRIEARRLRDANVRLIWLYISASDTSSEALGRERKYMAEEGDTTLVAASFQALGEEARMQILNASCKEDPEPETTTADPATPGPITTSPPSPAVPRSKTPSIPPSPVSTESDAHVTDPVTSSSDETETTDTPEATSTEAVTTFTPTASTMTSSPVPPAEAETEKTSARDSSSGTTLSPAGDPSSASGTSATEPATSEPSASTSGTNREEKTKTQTTDSDDAGSFRNKASTGEEEEEEEAWHERLENIVGVTVGGFAVVAVSSGCVYYAVWRRRKDRREKAGGKQDP